MINRRQLHENAVGNPLMKFVRQLRKDVDYLLHNAIVNPERLSDLSEDLGYIQAGAFICGTGSLEDGDFTGNMMIYPSYEDADGDNFTIFGMNNGTLTVGWNSDDGKFYFGAKAGWLDADGQSFELASAITDTPNQIKWLSGSTIAANIKAYSSVGSINASFDAQGILAYPAAYNNITAANYAGTLSASINIAAPATGYSNIAIVAGSIEIFGPATFNEGGDDHNTRVEGDTAYNLLVCDAGLDEVQIGTTVAGAIAVFGATGIEFKKALTLINNDISYAEIQNTAAANVVLGQTGVAGDIVEIPCTAAMRGLMDDTTLGDMKATLDLEIGYDVQAWDATLTDLAACEPTANGDFIVGSGFPDNGSWDRLTTAQARGVLSLGAILTGQAGEDTIDAASTEYLPLSGVAAASVYARRCFIIPFAGTAQNLYVRTTTSQPVGGSLVMTVQKNNVDTVVTVTVAAGGAAAITADTTHSFAFNKGDRLTLAAINNAGSNVSAGISSISLELLKDV